MLSPNQQHEVGERWISAEVRACYFAALRPIYEKRQERLTIATLVLSSGTFASLLTSLPPAWTLVRPTLALFTTFLSITSLVLQNAKKATECADLHSVWNSLANQLQILWNDLDASDGEERLQRLVEKTAEASKRATALPYKEKLMRNWQRYVQEHNSGSS